jgi:hypothetical protein
MAQEVAALFQELRTLAAPAMPSCTPPGGGWKPG